MCSCQTNGTASTVEESLDDAAGPTVAGEAGDTAITAATGAGHPDPQT